MIHSSIVTSSPSARPKSPSLRLTIVSPHDEEYHPDSKALTMLGRTPQDPDQYDGGRALIVLQTVARKSLYTIWQGLRFFLGQTLFGLFEMRPYYFVKS